jgi:alpha-L-arabinofuranosidase
MRAFITALTITLAAGSVYAREYHVSTTGLAGNPGTQSQPFKTISAAAQVAQPGDTITVHEGIYRERINPPRGGESDINRIIYRAATGEKVVIKGSEIVKGWDKVQGGVWKVTLPSHFLGEFNPYSETIGGEWYHTPRDGYDRHTGAVYLNGHWLDEAPSLERVMDSVPGRALWYAKVAPKHTTIWAQFRGDNPNTETVEINVRQSIFYPDRPGRNYITVRGFTMRHAATPWSGAMSEQIGLIGTHWSKGWVIENNVISHSMNTGITLGRYDLGAFGIAMPPATAPGFVTSCELALTHGWSKQTVGHHIIRNNHISHCEKNGIHGSLGGIFSTVEGNTICDIAQRGWISGPDVAGLKLLASHDTLIHHNHIYRCAAVGGIWLDWMAQGTHVTGNLLHDNSRDLFMEVNHGPFLIDHNLFLSSRSLRDWSQGGAYAHNLIAGSVEGRNEKRETPYFRRHTVQDMRLSNIQHRDLRFHNNLFAGSGGLIALGKQGEALRAVGNVYLAGAGPSTHEREALIDADADLGVMLQEKPDGWWLDMEIDPTWTQNLKRAIVTTTLLGHAKIPNAPFERPDGTAYRLDTDYFGTQRNMGNPAPGPFRHSNTKTVHRKVWPKEKRGRLTLPKKSRISQ